MKALFALFAVSGLDIGLGVAAAAVLIFGVIALRHRLTRGRVTARFEGFKEHVIKLREQVEAIKERHKLLPAMDKDYQETMTGETLVLYNQIQKDVGTLWDDWLKRMDIWDRVKVLIEAEKFPGVGRLKDAGRLLDQLGSFGPVDQACQACVTHLDQLEKGHEQAQKMLSQAVERPGQLRPQIEAVARLPLPTAPYETELTTCAGLAEQARKLLRADPIGAQSLLKQGLNRLAELDQCLKDVAQLFQQAQEARRTLDQVARLVGERRAGGLLLTEPEGNPDPHLEQGRSQHGQLLQALERGQAKAAAGHLEQALALADRAKSVVERQAAARDQCLREIPARRVEAQRLQQATATAQAQRGELERNFAPESWRNVADHLGRSRELQSSAEGLINEAATAAAESVQHYFRAGSLLERVQQQQDQVRAQLQEIGRCLQQLTETRQECYHRRQELADQARKAESYFHLHAQTIRQPARTRFDSAENRWRQARSQMEELRPNWPVVQQQMEEARKEYAAGLQEAEEDVRQQQQFSARLTQTSHEAERIGQFLQWHREDRVQANERYRSGVEKLDRIRRDSTGKTADWKQLLKEVNEAADLFKKAEELARQDLQLADRAGAEIDSAERELARARSYFQLGITANLAQAEDQLSQARVKLGEQAYEQAIDLAVACQKAARQAYEDAVRRAQQEQQRLDQERQPVIGGEEV